MPSIKFLCVSMLSEFFLKKCICWLFQEIECKIPLKIISISKFSPFFLHSCETFSNCPIEPFFHLKFFFTQNFLVIFTIKETMFLCLETSINFFSKHQKLGKQVICTRIIFFTADSENYGNKILSLLQKGKRDQIRRKGQYNSTA